MPLNDAEQALVHKAVTRLNQAAAYWDSSFQWWRTLLRNYNMEYEFLRDQEERVLYPYASQVFAPSSYEQIEVLVPLVTGMVLDHDPPFAAVKDQPGEDQRRVKNAEQLLIYQLRHRGFKREMIHAIQQTIKIGHQVLRVYWRKEKRRVRNFKPTNLLGVRIDELAVEQEEIVYDGPDFYRIPFYNFYIDPQTPPCDLQRARYLGYDDLKTLEEFLRDADYLGYDNVAQVKEALLGQQKGNPPAQEPILGGSSPQTMYDERATPADDYAQDLLMRYYWDHKEVLTLALPAGSSGQGILVKREKFEDAHADGKYPFVGIYNRVHTDAGVESSRDATADYHPGGFYPFGDLHPLHGLQQATNTSINQRIDNVTAGLRLPLLVLGDALEDEEKLALGWTQNPILHLRSDLQGRTIGEVVQQLRLADMFGGGWGQQMSRLDDWTVRTTGTFESLRGQSEPNLRTASAFLQANSNAMRRVGLKVYIICTMGIAEMLTMMNDLNADLLAPDTVYYVGGDSLPNYLSQSDIARGVSFSIRTIPPYSKALVSQQAVEAIKLLQEYYPWANLKRLVEMWMEGQDWIENADEIIPREAPDINFLDLKEALLAPPPAPTGPASTGVQSENPTEGMDAAMEAALQARQLVSLAGRQAGQPLGGGG